MTRTFYQSLNSGDWLAWTAICGGALLLVLLAITVAAIESQKP